MWILHEKKNHCWILLSFSSLLFCFFFFFFSIFYAVKVVFFIVRTMKLWNHRASSRKCQPSIYKKLSQIIIIRSIDAATLYWWKQRQWATAAIPAASLNWFERYFVSSDSKSLQIFSLSYYFIFYAFFFFFSFGGAEAKTRKRTHV